MNDSQTQQRRDFLKDTFKTSLTLGIGAALIGSMGSQALAADESEVSMPGSKKPVKSEELFRKGVIGPAELSQATSKIAVDKAMDKNTREFAGFELTEAIAVTTVLKGLGTPVPEPDEKAKATLAKLESASGAEFDKAYIAAQLENHEFLRDHAEDYLKETASKTDMAEKHTHDLATLALATFKEHVMICKRISSELS